MFHYRKRSRISRARQSSDVINHHQIHCDPLTSELMKHPDGIYSQQALQHDYLCTIHVNHPKHEVQQGHHLPMTSLTARTTPATDDESKDGEMYGVGGVHRATSTTPLGHECFGMHPVMTTKRGDRLYEPPRFPHPDMCPTTLRVQSVECMACVGVDGCEGKDLRTT